jgi:PIN domain nuclease of toxin-antitoxin system
VRLLLDTHIFLWVLAASPRLKPAARARIETADEVFVSAASIWEIAIKVRLGKFTADVDAVLAAVAGSGFSELPVRAVHAARVASLPAHHDDPFDRVLVAQALSEPLQLLTADPVVARYSDLVVLC